jgi:hypothetical protein
MSFSAARVIAAGVMAVLGVAAVAPPAFAIKPFYVELEAKYVRPDSKEQNDIALMIAFDQAGCTICHPGDDTHKLTRYGGQLAWRINKFDKGNKKKIQEAFDEVGALRSDPYDAKSPTYGELFRQGKLPPNPRH